MAIAPIVFFREGQEIEHNSDFLSQASRRILLHPKKYPVYAPDPAPQFMSKWILFRIQK